MVICNSEKMLGKLKKDDNNEGYVILRLFKCLLLQFVENLSDRDLGSYLAEIQQQSGFVALI